MAEFTVNNEEAQAAIKQILEQQKKVAGADRGFSALLSSVVFADIMSHFKNQEGSEGPWAAWSKVHADHMGKLGKSGNRILQDTGRLRQSFLPTNYRSVNDGILWFNPAKTAKGFPYAAAHDEGGPKLPKRDFMWLSDEALGRIEDVTLKFLEEE